MGKTLHFGRYELLHPLVGGAMSTVHLARDRVACREVVLKWCEVDSEEALGFELESLRRLDHPSVVRVENAFHDPDHGRRVLVEPRIEGVHLDQLELNDNEMRELVLLLIDALTAIHRQGIRHGDVKPANILVEKTDAGPRPIIIDFGLASRADDPTFLGGTPAYLAPEFQRGGRASTAADWWALGRSLVRRAGELPQEVQPLVDAMLLSDPDQRSRRLQEVLSLSSEQVPLQLPRRIPTMSPANSVRDGVREILAAIESAPHTQIKVTGDDATGRSAWLRDLARRLRKVDIPVIEREEPFTLDRLVAELLVLGRRHLPDHEDGLDDDLDVAIEATGGVVVLLHDRATTCAAAKELEIRADHRPAEAASLVVVAASDGSDRGVKLPPPALPDVSRVLRETLVLRDEEGAAALAEDLLAASGGFSGTLEQLLRGAVESRELLLDVDGTVSYEAGRLARTEIAREPGTPDPDEERVLQVLDGNGGALTEAVLNELCGLGRRRTRKAVIGCAAKGHLLRGAEGNCPLLTTNPTPRDVDANWELLDAPAELAKHLEPWLESVFPDAIARPVRHLMKRGETPDSQLVHLAVRGLLRANRAPDALALFEHLGDDEDMALLEARCLMVLGRPKAALSRLSRRAAPSPLVTSRLAHVQLALGRREDALASCATALSSGDARAEIEAHVLRALLTPDADEAERDFREALSRLEPDDHGRAGAVLSNYGAFLRRCGRRDEATTHLEAAVIRLNAHGDAAQRASAWSNLGAAFSDARRFRRAIEVLARARATFEVAQDESRTATVRANIGLTRYRAGMLSRAHHDLRREARSPILDDTVRERILEALDQVETMLGRFGAIRRRNGTRRESVSEIFRTCLEDATAGTLFGHLRSSRVEERLAGRAALFLHGVTKRRHRRRRLRSLSEFLIQLESGMTPRQTIAFRAATVIPLYQELVERLEAGVSSTSDTTPLLAVLDGVAKAAGREEALLAVVAGAAEVTRARRCFVLRESPKGPEILAADAESSIRDDHSISTRAIRRALTSGRPLFVTDAGSDHELGFAPSVQRHGLRSIACIPLETEDRATVLYLDSPVETGAFDDDDDRDLVQTLGRVCSLSLALFDRAESSRTDAEESSHELASRSAELSRLRSRLGDGFVPGSSVAISALNDRIERVATSDLSVLITGETGTGKEVTAQAIHSASQRRGGPFIPVNCAALPLQLAESELFGHVRGAFTGATRDEPGLMLLADGGTLFLDEVSDLPAELQPKLLRALETREVRPVGGQTNRSIDIRILSASHRDARSLLRDDLYFRLAGIVLEVPALKDRPEDIVFLARRFLREAGREAAFERAALDALQGFEWPGNVRQLKNVMQRCALLASGDRIRLTDLPEEIVGFLGREPRPLKDIERDALEEALRFTAGDKKQAASLLGISRTTLYNKLKGFGM